MPARRKTIGEAIRRIVPRNKQARVVLKHRMTPKNTVGDSAISALEALVEKGGTGMEQLMREVIQATLFLAYSERFARRSSVMRRLVVGDQEVNAKRRAYFLLRLQEAQLKLSKETQGTTEHYRLKGLVTRYTEAYSGRKPAKEAQRVGRVKTLPGGEQVQVTSRSYFDDMGAFGSKMADVLQRFKDKNGMRKSQRADSASVSFGSTRLMDTVETSSKAHPDSPNVLWRQLEFGSGTAQYAKKAGNVPIPRLPGTWSSKSGKYSKEYKERDPQTGRVKRIALKDGSWMLGGLRILGSEAGNWLRTKTGGAYTRDAQIYTSVFAARLDQQLRKRGK